MPWMETCVMDQKIQMIGDWLDREYDITELSKMYAISRKTVYKWIARYEAEGVNGLEERTRVPWSHPNATPSEIAAQILVVKGRHMKWGPKKVVGWLRNKYPDRKWPANSTTSEILKKEGLVRSRKRKRRTPPYTRPFLGSEETNAVWSGDFKGQFRMGDGKLCYPLTLSDNYSRYLLGCWGLSRPTYEQTRPLFEYAFREYGLPEAIRTDNGAPFASVALGGLSRLAVWLIKLGIRPERIDTGHPEQNGRHERMHRTLKESAISPPRHNLAEQQRAFERFTKEFNHERPHEALGQKTPGSVYRRSPREYPAKIPSVEYAGDLIIRQVRHNGDIKWRGRRIYISEALAGEAIGLKQMDNYYWEVYFSFLPLGILDESIMRITPL